MYEMQILSSLILVYSKQQRKEKLKWFSITGEPMEFHLNPVKRIYSQFEQEDHNFQTSNCYLNTEKIIWI